ncbi:Hypothetical predicted protein [Mytilus galloprovincialis]|uniref:Uncharacterized protein n=1 Tax=Mytilus galloprovincialis TaxID=29158 RepID=A0A8B6HQX9_MYTGA|nr:Hypothetical predicted protein [Mytilus galloprovincialis]
MKISIKENLLLKEKYERIQIIEGLKQKVKSLKEIILIKTDRERQRNVAKRDARKNEDFNKRELAAKREVRKDTNYRRAEAESKKVSKR